MIFIAGKSNVKIKNIGRQRNPYKKNATKTEFLILLAPSTTFFQLYDL